MKKYVEVFWAPWPDDINDANCWVNTVYLPPLPLLGVAYETVRDVDNFLFKCPAVKDVVKNDFVIRSPFDLTFTFDLATATVSTNKYGQTFFSTQIVNRSIVGGPIIVTAPPRYIFFSKDDIEMLSTDLTIISSVSNKNIKMIPGKYNISKWFRPIDFTFTVIDPSQPVTLKAEDPLWAVRFYTPNNVPVKMTRFELTQDVLNNAKSMMSLKNYRPLLPLKKCYELAEGVIRQLRNKF
jgi:hypothetical protein